MRTDSSGSLSHQNRYMLKVYATVLHEFSSFRSKQKHHNKQFPQDWHCASVHGGCERRMTDIQPSTKLSSDPETGILLPDEFQHTKALKATLAVGKLEQRAEQAVDAIKNLAQELNSSSAGAERTLLTMHRKYFDGQLNESFDVSRICSESDNIEEVD